MDNVEKCWPYQTTLCRVCWPTCHDSWSARESKKCCLTPPEEPLSLAHPTLIYLSHPTLAQLTPTLIYPTYPVPSHPTLIYLSHPTLIYLILLYPIPPSPNLPTTHQPHPTILTQLRAWSKHNRLLYRAVRVTLFQHPG